MCSNERTAAAAAATGAAPGPPPGLLPYPLAALKQLNEAAAAGAPSAVTASSPATAAAAPMAPNLLPLDYRLQLYNYAMAERLRFSHQLSQAQHYPAPLPLYPGYPPYGPRLAFSMSLFHHRALQPEEPKPQHSYIGLIAMAILSSPENKLVLSDIYQYILDNYPYFRTRGPGWRNSIRHNLSLNDCFIKAGRSANGKGHYWAIHPANIEDFKKGDFRRRKAQRKVRKHMGLAVDEEGNDSPSPPPVPGSPPSALPAVPGLCWAPAPASTAAVFPALQCGAVARKRQFDVASLLAPDDDDDAYGARKAARRALQPLPPAPAPAPVPAAAAAAAYASSGEDDAGDEDIDVVTSDQETETRSKDERDASAPDAAAAAEGDRLPELPPPPQTPQGSPSPHPPPQPPSAWPATGGAPAAAFPQQPASFMFPNSGLVSSVEHQLVSRYYEQLAQQHQQQHRRLLHQHQQAPPPQPAPGVGPAGSLSPAPGASPLAPEAAGES